MLSSNVCHGSIVWLVDVPNILMMVVYVLVVVLTVYATVVILCIN